MEWPSALAPAWAFLVGADDDCCACVMIVVLITSSTTKHFGVIPAIDTGITLCCSVRQCLQEIQADGDLWSEVSKNFVVGNKIFTSCAKDARDMGHPVRGTLKHY